MLSSRRHFLGLVGAAGSIGVTGCNAVEFGGEDPTPTPSPVTTPWPMFRHDPQNTGVTDAPGPTAPVTKQWRVRLTGKGRYQVWGASPVVVDTTVYVGGHYPGTEGASLYALSIADGSVQWRYDLSRGQSNQIGLIPAVVDGTVYTATLYGDVYALDPAADTEKWDVGLTDDFPWVRVRARNDQWRYKMVGREQPGSGADGSPAVVDGTVYITSEYGPVYALDAAAGTVQWRQDIDGDSQSSAVAGDTVYVGAYSNTDDPPVEIAGGNVYALAADDGTERWRYTLDDRAPRAVAVANDTVYVSTASDQHDVNTLYALAAADGSERWATQPVATFPAVTDDTVYVGSEDGHVYAFAAADGTQRWRYFLGPDEERAPPQSPSTPSPTPTPGADPLPAPGAPVVADDTVYVSGGSYIHALAATDGAEQWTIRGTHDPGSSPAVVDDTVYVMSSSSTSNSIYAITEA